ncbi:E3 ubiquitin-protein ligase TRIM39-like [Conger conger]|uniref:E3 ubiquitin-protein ligase TRIM39-like n=1 Tax=Conger conger TaxID=82655 RepID=UPI002A598EE9|nr:E3 ubiquitin-protein ligase TRIM39-like [Conger conger]
MALARNFLSEEQFLCSICLDVFSNPVSTPCGHSFCKACIGGYWDGQSKAWQCPLCKESFRKRPELHINRTLREITEQFKRMSGGGASGGGPAEGGAAGVGALMGGAPGGGALGGVASEERAQRRGELPGPLFAEMKKRFLRPPAGQPHAPPPTLSSSAFSPALPPETPSPPALALRRNTLSDIHSQSPPSDPSPAPSHNSTSSQSCARSHSPTPSPAPEGVSSGLGPRRYTVSSGPAESLATPLCARHGLRLELFCRAEQECVCSACMDTLQHEGHTAVPVKREWLIKKSQLGVSEAELHQLMRDRERKVEEIRASMTDIREWAQRETQGCVRGFSALQRSVERSQAELLEVIELNRRVAERQAQALIQELQQDIEDLRRRSAELAHLLHSDDHMLLLRTFPTICIPPQTKDWSQVSVTSDLVEGSVLRTLSQLVEKCQEELRRLPELSLRASAEHSLLRYQPKVKRVQEYAVEVTLDPHTAHPRLILSEDRKQVRCGERHQLVPDNPERFDRVVCVLGRQGFSAGRHYWEVEVGGKTDWDLGVASHSVNRKGKITVSPAHGYWFLSLRDRSEYAFRTDPSTSLGLSHKPRRIGVYLDYHKGQVSFYNVEARLLIYTFIDTFTDSIHPFFSPCTNKSGKNEAPLVISPVTLSD